MRALRIPAFSALLIVCATSARAESHWWFSAGADDDGNATNSVHAGRVFVPGATLLGLDVHHEASVALLRSGAEPRRQTNTLDVGYGFLLRAPLGERAYFEAGTGPHLITSEYVGNRDMSTLWHFGSIAGLGLRVGRLELGYRWLHLSNGEVVLPNRGIDLHQLRVAILP